MPFTHSFVARWARLCALVVVAPLLVAAACNEPDLTFSLEQNVFYIEQSNSLRVRVQNVGGVDATLGEVSGAALGLAPPFALDTSRSTCTTGTVLAKSHVGTCTLEILFTPRDVGEYRQTLQLAYGWGDGETRSESHEIVANAKLPVVVFTPNGDSGAYWAKPLLLSTRQDHTVRNAGTSELILGDMSDAGLGLQPPFHRTGGTCATGQRLAGKTNCSIFVSFTPTALGGFTDTATIRWGFASRGTLEFSEQRSLFGAGTEPVRASRNVPLSEPTAPGSSRRDIVTLTNWGGAPAVLGTIDSAALGLAPPFSLAGGTCTTGAVLAPQTGSCTLELQFSPTSSGAFADELQVAYTYGGAAFAISKPLSSRAQASPSANCFDTGCAAGQICSATSPGVGACVEVPPPPPNCMAPCLWEAFRHCLPSFGACTQGTSATTMLTCDANTGWAHEMKFANNPEDRITQNTFRRFGSACYVEQRRDMSDVFFSISSSFSDGAQVIAHSDNLFVEPGSRHVFCGPYTEAPGGVTPFIERSSTECTAWKNQYLNSNLLTCQSVSPGTCSGL